jgi:hypothetical protein
MSWTVTFTSKAGRQAQKLPKKERALLALLVKDLQLQGYSQPNWKNYSRLGKDVYHCHLSYKWVACWIVKNGRLKLMEIYYAGSRENAPY